MQYDPYKLSPHPSVPLHFLSYLIPLYSMPHSPIKRPKHKRIRTQPPQRRLATLSTQPRSSEPSPTSYSSFPVNGCAYHRTNHSFSLLKRRIPGFRRRWLRSSNLIAVLVVERREGEGDLRLSIVVLFPWYLRLVRHSGIRVRWVRHHCIGLCTLH
jgi:hypothetical protein